MTVQFTPDTDLNPRGKALTKTGLRQAPGTSDKAFVKLVKLKKMTARQISFKSRLSGKGLMNDTAVNQAQTSI